MPDSGMILVKESFLNKLLLKTLPPVHITKSELAPDELAYFNEINSIINQSVLISIAWLESEAAKEYFENARNLKRDFFKEIEESISEIVNSKANTVDEMLDNFYEVGKKHGFKQIRRDIVFSPADANALFNIKNYNFDLIRNLSDDLKNQIREKVWRGVAEGQSIPIIARSIRDLPLEPLKNGVSVQSRAMMIARTEVMRAKNTGCLQAYKDYGIDSVKIVGIGDGKECPKCLDLVNGGPYSILEAATLLPAHPNCRHHFAPYMDALLDPVNLGATDFVDMTINN